MAQAVIAGRFEIGPLIGAGATGSVYAGSDRLTGEKVAIKALRQDLVASIPEVVERFRREGEALRKLNHPNIVKVLATVEEDRQHYLIMEYVSGGSLADLLKRAQQLPIEQVLSISLELADALSRAHHLEILHRDIKPGNILLAGDGTPRLTDFGLAHMGGYPAITSDGAILGTFHYLSPEACENQALDARADIWSFGVVLYEMLTGQLPFNGDTPFEILWAIKNQPLPDPAWRREGIPADLAGLLQKMLMKDRLARLSSTRLAGAELETIQKRMVKEAQKMKDIHREQAPRAANQPAEKAQPASAKIRVLIVDDHAVVRQGLRTFIDLQDDMVVVGEGSDGVEAVALAAQLSPDVILLDLVMPRMDGVEATGKIFDCSPHSRVIILTSFGEDDKVFPAIRAGAQGYLLKDIHPNDLVQAVREAHHGKAQLHPDIAQKLMTAVASGPAGAEAPRAPASAPGSAPRELHDLTAREIEVLRLIAQGLSNHEIAGAMFISEKTVKTHVSNVLAKLGVEDRTQAAIWALKHGLGPED